MGEVGISARVSSTIIFENGRNPKKNLRPFLVVN